MPPHRRIVARAAMSLDGRITDDHHTTHAPEPDLHDVLTELAALKRQPGKNITVTGGLTLIRSLLRAGLVDDLHLHVHPLITGGGHRLFTDTGVRVPLTLLDATTSPTGTLHLHYRPTATEKEPTHG